MVVASRGEMGVSGAIPIPTASQTRGACHETQAQARPSSRSPEVTGGSDTRPKREALAERRAFCLVEDCFIMPHGSFCRKT